MIGEYVVCTDLKRKRFIVVDRPGYIVQAFHWTTPYPPDSARAAAFAWARASAKAGSEVQK